MSTDYEIACMTCQVKRHLGQRFASMAWSFGYGSSDRSDGTIQQIGEFIQKHAEHDLRVFWAESSKLDGMILIREKSDE